MKFAAIALVTFIGWSVAAAQALEGSAAAQSPGPLVTVPALDVQRYMGTWYEIAKYPNWFQKKCVAETRAEYKLQTGGSVQVINRCRKDTAK